MNFEKFDSAAAQKTHGVVSASFVDVLMPHTELKGSTANLLRSAAYAAIGWVGSNYKKTGNFGF